MRSHESSDTTILVYDKSTSEMNLDRRRDFFHWSKLYILFTKLINFTNLFHFVFLYTNFLIERIDSNFNVRFEILS
jgi:hypothetical protein